MIGNPIGYPIGGVINYGGNLFTQTVAVSTASTVAVARSVTKIISTATTNATSFVRRAGKSVSITALSTFSTRKAVTHIGPSISTTGTTSILRPRNVLKAIAIASSGLIIITLHAGRVLVISIMTMGNVSIAKQATKTVAAIALSVVTVTIGIFRRLGGVSSSGAVFRSATSRGGSVGGASSGGSKKFGA